METPVSSHQASIRGDQDLTSPSNYARVDHRSSQQERSSSRELKAENGGPARRKPKQTRNKPTLSCLECVTHKTKCDRGRPVCLACLKRKSSCQYSRIADVLATSGGSRSHRRRQSSKTSISEEHINHLSPISHSISHSDHMSTSDRPLSKCSIAHITHSQSGPSPTSYESPHWNAILQTEAISQPSALPVGGYRLPAMSTSNTMPSFPAPYHFKDKDDGRSPMFGTAGLLPSMDNTPMSVFGMGGEHPFANYWTCKGGLAEVIRVLPSKEQADILVAQYFQIIDPIYPVIDRIKFLKEYEDFWSLSFENKCAYDAATVSLHFVIYAAATQFIKFDPPSERTTAAEFYVSAGHQALRISSYLNRMTITTVQTMIIIFYFLTHDNHISDAWTFSGITQRQAYVLQLNREPTLITPGASIVENNLRCKLWAAIIFQEQSIALSLRLPSTSLQSDVGPHSLKYEESEPPMRTNILLDGARPSSRLSSEYAKTDISYCKSIWAYSSFVQENICGQRALGLPICRSNEHKREMLSAFRSLYRSFPAPFGSYDPERYFDPGRRVARQQIALTQCFFHAMMLICADENAPTDLIIDSYGTFEAAHEAMAAFFKMDALFGDETSAWWAYQHKAYEEAMLVANLLAADTKPFPTPEGSTGLSREYAMLATAKEDIQTLLGVMRQDRGFFEFQDVQDRRIETLEAVFGTIKVV